MIRRVDQGFGVREEGAEEERDPGLDRDEDEVERRRRPWPDARRERRPEAIVDPAEEAGEARRERHESELEGLEATELARDRHRSPRKEVNVDGARDARRAARRDGREVA